MVDGVTLWTTGSLCREHSHFVATFLRVAGHELYDPGKKQWDNAVKQSVKIDGLSG